MAIGKGVKSLKHQTSKENKHGYMSLVLYQYNVMLRANNKLNKCFIKRFR